METHLLTNTSKIGSVQKERTQKDAMLLPNIKKTLAFFEFSTTQQHMLPATHMPHSCFFGRK